MKKDFCLYLLSLTAALLFVYLLSVACSPLYGPDSTVFDAGVFQTVGYQWTKGHIPYLELWDHKGPLIFLFNAIGFLLTGTKTGIMLLEGLSISFFIFLTYKTLRIQFSVRSSAIGATVTLLLLAGTYAGGDNVEEIILPLLSFCFYKTQLWIKANKTEPMPFGFWNSAFIGAVIAVGLLTRLTNAAACGGIIAGASVFAIRDKDWHDLWSCIRGVLLVFVLPIVPFAIYFYWHDALLEAVQCTLGFNGSYATSMSQFPVTKYISHLFTAAPCYCLFALSAISIAAYKQKHSLVWLLATALTATWWLPSRMFLKYAIIGVPFFPILLMELKALTLNLRWKRATQYVLFTLVTLVPLTNLRFIHQFKNKEIVRLTEYLKQDIGKAATFIAYDTTAQIYLSLDAMPSYRYFYHQEFCSNVSSTYESDMLQEYNTSKAEWVLVFGESPRIDHILKKHYHLYREYADLPGYSLYKRND